MTYQSLLTAIYANYHRLLPLWEAERERAESVGVFAFLPEDYEASSTFHECTYTFWPMSQVAMYVQTSGIDDEGYKDLEEDLETGEFLVMVVERLEGGKQKGIHIHKISHLAAN